MGRLDDRRSPDVHHDMGHQQSCGRLCRRVGSHLSQMWSPQRPASTAQSRLAALPQPGPRSGVRQTGTTLSGTVGYRITGGVNMDRRRMLHTFKAAQEVGNYEDVPVLPADVDPQLYMSRNAVAQPFYL